MADTRVLLLRHGQTDFNRDGRVQGQVDIELSEAGRAQAHRAGAALAAYQPDLIVSSDLARALQTAQIVAEYVRSPLPPVVTDERLRERAFGQLEGLTRQQMEADYAHWYRQWKETGECEPAGIEHRGEVGRRVAEAIEDHALDGAVVLIVAHGSALVQATSRLLGHERADWGAVGHMGNCHWSLLTRINMAPGWELTAHNLGAPEPAEAS